MIQLTRIQIINEGLDRAGRPDLLSQGRLWLNLFLDKIYQNQDYHWLVKSSGSLSATQDSALPTDYRAAVSATFGDPGQEKPIDILWDAAEFDNRKNLLQSGAVDIPQFVYIDQVTKTVKFLPPALGGKTWNLQYYHVPTIPTHLNSSGDNQVPVWGAPMSILTDAIFQKALEYNDDQRQGPAFQTLQGEIIENKKNNHDRRAGKSRLKMGKSFRNRFGTRRGF
jgi:hypothetical protein